MAKLRMVPIQSGIGSHGRFVIQNRENTENGENREKRENRENRAEHVVENSNCKAAQGKIFEP